MSKLILFEDEDGQHIRGGEKCSQCCCGPDKCPECGGLRHDYLIGEEYTEDDYYWVHAYQCEKCNHSIMNDEKYLF